MNATTPLDAGETLRQIQARADAATPGPWEACCYDSGHSRFEMSCSVITSEVGDTIADLDGRLDNERLARDDGQADAAFIAHARQDVPALVAALRTVLDLHQPGIAYGVSVCQTCSQVKGQDEWDDPNDSPIASWLPWPCPTVAAVTSALSEVRP